MYVLSQAQVGWFGKRWKKYNHSTGALSFLIPSFLNLTFYEEDPITQIEIDNSRNILYTRSEKGTIEVYFLGLNGNGTSRIASLSQAAIVQHAVCVVK